MRTPLPHFIVSGDEWNMLEGIAEQAKVGWFSLCDKVDGNGKGYTLVFDTEKRRCVSLQYGVRMLLEGISYGYCDMAKEYGLNGRKTATLANLVVRLNIARHFPN